MQIDLRNPAVAEATKKLRQVLISASEEKLEELGMNESGSEATKFERAFEREYQCELISEDPFYITGYIKFDNEPLGTLFLLKYGS